jgi:hypothetical protein
MRIAILALAACCFRLTAADVATVFPLQTGNRWTYEHEDRSGDRRHPVISRWITVTTVRGSVTIPEGKIILRDTKFVNGQSHGSWIGEHGSFHYLLRGECLYFLNPPEWDEDAKRLTPEFRDLVVRGMAAPDLCFPLAPGKHWRGNADQCGEWFVEGRQQQPGAFVPFSVEARDVHLFSPQRCGGEIGHRWFRVGTGITGEWIWHNGTFGEIRVRLMKFEPNGPPR